MICVVQEAGHGAAGEAGFSGVGTAGEDDGNAGAEDDAGQLRATEIFKLLGEHVATFEIGNDEDIGLSSDGRVELLDAGGLFANRGIEGERPVEDAAGDLSAVGHLAKRGGLHCGGDFGIHSLYGGKQCDLGLGNAEGVSEIYSVLYDVNLVFKLGLDIDGGIGDEQGPGIGGGVHHEHVADAAGGAEAGFALHGSFHQLVRMQAALHHGLGVAAAAHGDAEHGSFVFGFCMEDGEGADVGADFRGKSANGFFVANEGRFDEPFGGRFDCAVECDIRERPHNGRCDGGKRFAAIEKFVEDVVVGGVFDEAMDGNRFGEGG